MDVQTSLKTGGGDGQAGSFAFLSSTLTGTGCILDGPSELFHSGGDNVITNSGVCDTPTGTPIVRK